MADALRLIAMMVWPITPRAAQSLWERLGFEGSIGSRSFERDGDWGLLPAGVVVEAGEPLFPRLEA